jgi:hypothetical protein
VARTLELQRDPVRATLALAGSVVLLLVMGFGISIMNELRYAILDRDQSSVSGLCARYLRLALFCRAAADHGL